MSLPLWKSTSLEQIQVSSLIPNARNARTHSKAQVKQIAASIKAFGFTNPVLIDMEGVILAGHGRTMAAEILGMQEVPCIRVPLSGVDARAYMLADNRLAELAGCAESEAALHDRRVGRE